MKTWVENKWDLLRTSFLFLPLLMSFISVAACLVLAAVDARLDIPPSDALGWLRAGDAEGVRSLLIALIGSLMTALSIVFSITVVALTLAASQLGPRLLRSFMRDRANQAVLGVFISTFLYCLVTLRIVGAVRPEKLPHITVLGGFLLACVSFVLLIYFIHHAARSIQAPNVVTSVSKELGNLIERLFPESIEEGRMAEQAPESLPAARGTVTADWDGYLQAVDARGLLAIAAKFGVILHVVHRPGHFVAGGERLVEVCGPEEMGEELDRAVSAVREALAYSRGATRHDLRAALPKQEIRESIILGSERTATQDPEFVMLQLVEIATRALSPGINDPFTAMTCIDRLSAALCEIARRRMPPAVYYDDDGNLRLVLDQTDFAGVCNAAFNQIRQHARGNAAVVIRLLEGLQRLAGQVRTDEQRAAVWRHARMVHRTASDLPEPADRENVDARLEAVREEIRPYLDEMAQAE